MQVRDLVCGLMHRLLVFTLIFKVIIYSMEMNFILLLFIPLGFCESIGQQTTVRGKNRNTE